MSFQDLSLFSAKEMVEQAPGQTERFVRGQVEMLAGAVPKMPGEAAAASQVVARDIRSHGFARLALAMIATVGAAALAEWLLRRALLRATRRQGVLVEFAPLLAFAAVGLALFLSFTWPEAVRRAMLILLLAVGGYRLLRSATGLLLAASSDAALDRTANLPRSIDIDQTDVPFWQNRLEWGAAIAIAGWALVGLLPALGISSDVQRVIAYSFGLGVLSVAIDVVWRRPSFRISGSAARGWALTAYLIALWLVWVMGLVGLFWIGVYVLVLPKAIRAAERTALRITGGREASLSRRMVDVAIVRGARALVLAAAVGWLFHVWEVRAAVIGESPLMARLAEGVVKGAIILLAADLIWQVSRAFIEYRLDAAAGGETAEEMARNGRLRTLLPIFRNTLGVFIAVVAVLMVLSGLGVEVGPLVAGAGIFGVAVGFGAQTLVKDILSGVFYMLDDAFRVGEYIQSGSYKGTVESFSLRSVRLRHHRGPVYTVPFGELGAVQNMS